MFNIILAGIGGQGIITASNIVLETALNCGYDVRSAETIGMAQKGGSVCSHIRIGTEIYSPLIPYKQADEIIVLDEEEASRYETYLKQDGLMRIAMNGESGMYFEGSDTIGKKLYDIQKACHAIGSSKFLNILMLGVTFSDKRNLINNDNIEQTLKKRFKGEVLNKNLQALLMGHEIGRRKKYE